MQKYLCASDGQTSFQIGRSYLHLSVENFGIEESLNDFVMKRYKKFEFVNSIFFQKYKRRELRFYVYFESEQYDSNIMDQLISTELEILDRYPDLHIDIIYCPNKIEKDSR